MDEESICERFGRVVRRARERQGLSQQELADKAELHRTYVNGIEQGKRNVGLLTIHRLAKALKVEPRDLL